MCIGESAKKDIRKYKSRKQSEQVIENVVKINLIAKESERERKLTLNLKIEGDLKEMSRERERERVTRFSDSLLAGCS